MNPLRGLELTIVLLAVLGDLLLLFLFTRNLRGDECKAAAENENKKTVNELRERLAQLERMHFAHPPSSLEGLP